MTHKEAARELINANKDSRATKFHAILFRLIQKADQTNLEKLRSGFREEVEVYEDWLSSESEEEFFKKFGLDF